MDIRLNQAGVSLIETLVSLFVFSVGALGLAAMQINSITSSGDTRQRSLAIWKAQELGNRMRMSKSSADSDGLLAEYSAQINTGDGGIGTYNDSAFSCSSAPATRCADYTNSSGTKIDGVVCNTAQLVKFDIWDVLCEPNTGLSPAITLNEADRGIVGLVNLEVAMVAKGDDYLLYFEWLARSADSNLDLQSMSAGAVKTVKTNLCGADINIDSRLDAYCLRIR